MTVLLRGRHRLCLGLSRHQRRLLVLEAPARTKYPLVLLRHSWRIIRPFRRKHGLDAVRAAEVLDGDTDHLFMAHVRQAKCADPAATTPTLFRWLP